MDRETPGRRRSPSLFLPARQHLTIALDRVTKADARDFKDALAAGDLVEANERRRSSAMSMATVERHIREAKTIFQMAVDEDRIVENPFAKLGATKPVKPGWHYVESEEFGRMMQACQD